MCPRDLKLLFVSLRQMATNKLRSSTKKAFYLHLDIDNYSNTFKFYKEMQHILKAIKNTTGTSVVFPVNISFIHYVLVLTSVPNVGERFTKT